MAMTIWQPRRRLFTVAASLMILAAAAHTAGISLGAPVNAEEHRVTAAMKSFRMDFGLGTKPSMLDIFQSLAVTMSLTLGALGLINLLLAGSADTPDHLLRRVSWVNLIWVSGFLVLNWICQLSPPLLSAVLLETAVVGSLCTLRR